MQIKKTQTSSFKERIDNRIEVLRTWKTPGPGFDPYGLRPKEFKLVRFDNGCLAVCKMDSAAEYIAHEAEVLRSLGDIEYVPSLIHQTPEAIYMRYIKGKLLPEAIGGLGVGECMKIGWQIVVIVAGIHKKGVVHSDIRPWNFIYGDDGTLYLIDFEYAYSRSQKDDYQLLSVHHGSHLKTAITDWNDALKSIGNAWQASNRRLVRFVLAYLPLSLRFGLRPILLVQQFGNWLDLFTWKFRNLWMRWNGKTGEPWQP